MCQRTDDFSNLCMIVRGTYEIIGNGIAESAFELRWRSECFLKYISLKDSISSSISQRLVRHLSV